MIQWRWFVVSCALFALCISALYLQAALFAYSDMNFTLGDYLVSFVAGMKQFVLLGGEPFQFPSAWAAVFLLVAFLTLWYPYRDLLGMGTQIMVWGGSRWVWWLSKCAWISLCVLTFFALACIVAVIWTLVFGGELSLSISEELPSLLGFRASQLASQPYDVLEFLLLVPWVTITLCLLQLLLSLVVRPLFSYIAIVSILFFSAFYFSPFLIGNYLMAARSDAMMQGGVEAGVGFILSAGLSMLVVFGGGLIFSRMDILNKEDLS